MTGRPAPARDVTLLDLLDRVLEGGVILDGEVIISVADVDLVYLGLNVMLASVDRARLHREDLERTLATETSHG